MNDSFPQSRRGRRERIRRQRNRLRFEQLEHRRLLATLTVTSTADAVDSNPGDGICEISSGGPCSLRGAIQEANALGNSAGSHQINLPAGTYTLSLAGTDEGQALTGDLDITGDLILQGAGLAETIIDAASIDRAIDVVSGTVMIRDVTIRGGVVQDDEFPFAGSGGGIRNEGDLTITDTTLTGNIATIGAGVANLGGTLKISRSLITGNGSDGTQRGGGVSNYSTYDPANLEISDTTITNNQADTGGGISNRSYEEGTANTTISRSTLSGNTAQDGGGISNRSVFNYYDGVTAKVTIRGSTISGNVASLSGGGIHNEADSGAMAIADVANSTITNNAATTRDGGGVLNVTGASITITSVIVAANTAGEDGADLSSDSTDVLFSLIGSPLGHSVVDGTGNNLVGKDPILGLLADNGGPTLTHSLQPGSPAIDQGSNPELLSSDQRGTAFARTIDDTNIDNASDGTDIGSIEVGQIAATDDFGDAPEAITVGGTLRQYPTRLASNGARHRLTAGGPSLGSLTPDAESDGQPTATASGDDLVGVDDEDALGPLPIVLTPGQSLSGFSISQNGGDSGALLSAWIDLNLDGDWDDPNEQFLTDVAVPAGASTTSLANIVIPSNAATGTTFIRVRISTESGLTPRGAAGDGEVEDFVATIGTPPPQIADLSLSQSVSNTNPALGQDVTFTITLNNDGPDRATNVEVDYFLPFDLIFKSSSVSQGQYDDLDGIWSVGNLAAGESAVLTVTVTVDSTDSITTTAEVTTSDQVDPDSTPGNGISGEDDQFSIAIGTCLAAGPIHVGLKQLTYRCATPGSFSSFLRGTERGSHTFDQYGITVDIADPQPIAIAIADINGVAVALFQVSESDLEQTILVQAFEMLPLSQKSNTLELDSSVQMLRAAAVGPGGLALQPEILPASIDAAIKHWESAGVSAVLLAKLRSTHVTLSDLPGDAIGRVLGGTIVLDRDAAGNGWFVDSTPADQEEFNLDLQSHQYDATASRANDRMDLVTAMIHEFGHMLGLPDLADFDNVMHNTLDVGVRRLPRSNTNGHNSFDVNDDQVVSALDALIVINSLNKESANNISEASLWVGASGPDSIYLDTNADFIISPLDALLVINQLRHLPSQVASGEEAVTRADWTIPAGTFAAIAETTVDAEPESGRDSPSYESSPSDPPDGRIQSFPRRQSSQHSSPAMEQIDREYSLYDAENETPLDEILTILSQGKQRV